ncbi:MAG: hypothetical protein H6735_24885 [Alphaproteobacteria bacterium]|nr:hypothetical protein [Alphaproteobacteria bacterium]
MDLRSIYLEKEVTAPPPPWRRTHVRVSGVAAVGFAPATELLVVVSFSGLGIVDCTTGETVARRRDDTGLVPEDHAPMFVRGFGPLTGREVAVAGLWGGGLRTTTADGWVLHRIAPHWPTEGVVLCPPSAPELSMDPSGATLLVSYRDTPIRAFGFSDSGRSIVVATTDLHVWTR